MSAPPSDASSNTLNTEHERDGTHAARDFNDAASTDADDIDALDDDHSEDIGTANVPFRDLYYSSEIRASLRRLNSVSRKRCYVLPPMKGTREYVFDEINNWVDDINAPNILLITGSPGAGKSAIVSGLVTKLSKEGRLGASFFFRKDEEDLRDPGALWRTVAHDMAGRFPSFSDSLMEALNDGRVDIRKPDIHLHFKHMIEEPLLKSYGSSTTPIIVIDALDECDRFGSQAAQRNVLLDTLARWPHLPKAFKLIITGRDDGGFKSFRSHCKQITLSTGYDVTPETNDGIRCYFEGSFKEIRSLTLAPEWPGEKAIDQLVAQAAGRFIWAEMVVKNITEGSPNEQLNRILSGDLGDQTALTELYRQLLDYTFRDIDGRELEVYKLVLYTIILNHVPLTFDTLCRYASVTMAETELVLEKLATVISIGKKDKGVRLDNLFSEFLCDRNRCPEKFFIDCGGGRNIIPGYDKVERTTQASILPSNKPKRVISQPGALNSASLDQTTVCFIEQNLKSGKASKPKKTHPKARNTSSDHETHQLNPLVSMAAPKQPHEKANEVSSASLCEDPDAESGKGCCCGCVVQ